MPIKTENFNVSIKFYNALKIGIQGPIGLLIIPCKSQQNQFKVVLKYWQVKILTSHNIPSIYSYKYVYLYNFVKHVAP